MEKVIKKVLEEDNHFLIKEIEINSINGAIRGDVFLSYKENLSLQDEEIIIKKIGNEIFQTYPEQFLGENSTDSLIVFSMTNDRKWYILRGGKITSDYQPYF